jgi:hypothetical protein
MGDNLGPNGLSRGLQGFLLQVDIAEIVVHEGDEPNAVIDFFDSEALAGLSPMSQAAQLLCSRSSTADW